MKKKALIVTFKGGLGNQMFQYALYKKLESMGRNVIADLSWFKQYNKEFLLTRVFPRAVLKSEEAKEAIEGYKEAEANRGVICKKIHKVYPLGRYYMYEKEDTVFQPEVLKYKRGVLDGYWQTSKYWNDIRDVIKHDFSFLEVQDENVLNLIDIIESSNTVSVHIRRGDYLLPENQALFGNICTLEYYQKAIAYMRNKFSNIKIMFFTNDPEWVKEQFKLENAVYANDYINSEMPDWYDMYLMSKCNHHIIANSTFSWWGAYLNSKKDKTVIAPSKWLNGNRIEEIYEDNWIKI